MFKFRAKEATMAEQGSPISIEIKKTIVTVKEYFDRTKNDEKEQDLPSVQKSAHALGIGLATVKRVMAAYSRDPNFSETRAVYRGRPPRAISESLQTVIRNYIREANENGRYVTLDVLKEYLEKFSPDQSIYIRTLARTLDRWGFTFGKGTRSQHLKEKDHVIAARHRYLRAKRENRKGRETIRMEVYIDESYVNKNHSNDFIWYSEEDGPWIQKPTGKGERLIILNAITANGWVKNAKLVFKSTKKTGDYHGQMNNELFSKWFKDQLLPNIPRNSLITSRCREIQKP